VKIKLRSRIIVFVLAYLTWLALTGIKSSQEIISGLVFAILVSIAAGHFFITTEKSAHLLRRTYFFILYIIRFIWEMIKANLHVAYLVIHPFKPIRPGIVKIKTLLTKDSALTVLSNSITLTPGTLTVDINKEAGEIYIHCIDVHTENIEDNTKKIGSKFESILKEVFE
jgi:multicomponent Na+:H+ antiporter subunit E